MNTIKAVGYIRVSTRKQENSGLSIENQEYEIRAYCKQQGYELTALYTEQGSGGNDDRNKLKDALNQAKKDNCKLITAKVDRVARSSYQLAKIVKSVDFETVEFGAGASKMTISIMGVIAEMELENIKERNQKSIATRKRRNIENGLAENFGFGNDYFKGVQDEVVKQGRLKGALNRKTRAKEKHHNAVEILKLLYKDIGYKPSIMAKKLDVNFGILNNKGQRMTTPQVAYLFKRYVCNEIKTVNSDLMDCIPSGMSLHEYATNNTTEYCLQLKNKGYSLGNIAKHLNANNVHKGVINYYATTIKRMLDKELVTN